MLLYAHSTTPSLVVMPNSISGIVSSVDCSENTTNQFAKVCNFCFSTMLLVLQIWVQNNPDYSLEKYAHLVLFMVKALLTIKCRGQIWGKKCCVIVQKYTLYIYIYNESSHVNWRHITLPYSPNLPLQIQPCQQIYNLKRCVSTSTITWPLQLPRQVLVFFLFPSNLYTYNLLLHWSHSK